LQLHVINDLPPFEFAENGLSFNIKCGYAKPYYFQKDLSSLAPKSQGQSLQSQLSSPATHTSIAISVYPVQQPGHTKNIDNIRKVTLEF
jgi:hypothetical protein